MSFAKNMGRNIGKTISKNLSSKYSQKLIDHAKQSATGARKISSKREATGDLTRNKIADNKCLKNSTKNFRNKRRRNT